METRNEFKVKGEDLMAKIRELIHQGNITRIIVKNDEGKVYLEIPVNVGMEPLLYRYLLPSAPWLHWPPISPSKW
mgnify:CR=1 FL=1